MSTVFSKNKEKRPHASSSEANTSFVRNVTSRVSGMLPSTITKWFSSPSTSNANGSVPMAEGSDSSTDDETADNPGISQPPAKRMRFNPPGTYNHYGPADASCSTYNVEITELSEDLFNEMMQFPQSSRNTFSTPMRPPNEDHPMDRIETEPTHMFHPQHTVAGIGQSIANKRRSIFETTSSIEPGPSIQPTTNTMRDPKQHTFKPTMLGSPFYPGRTMYGGAASSYINQPNIKQQSVAVVNESNNNDDTAISSSARRIMDLLESYSSPLKEARRIPQYTRPKNDSFNTSDRHPYPHKGYSYKTQELYVPNIASILRLKKKSRLMDTTNAARQIIASHSSASSYPSYPPPQKGTETEEEQPKKMTTKVKSRLTRTNRGLQDEVDLPTPVKLPAASLMIDQDKLPKFSFGTPAVTKQPTTSTPKSIFSTADVKITEVPPSKRETVTTRIFKFSSPVRVSSETPQDDTTLPKYKFDSPERHIDQTLEQKRDECSVVVGKLKETEKSTTTSKDWQCSDCWVKNKPDVMKCVCCGAKQPSQTPKCSVCKLADCQPQKNECSNCLKMNISQVASPPTVDLTRIGQSPKWKCEDCWVSNDDTAVKCACCGGSRPRKTPPTATVTSKTATVTMKTSTVSMNTNTVATTSAITSSKAEANWKCDDCWISNKSSVDKCAACGGAKPGAKQNSAAPIKATTTSMFGSTDNTFKNIVKSQKSEKWECSSCLVRNDKEKDKCDCCGAEKESNKKLPASKFNFGMVANSSFKFGIDSKQEIKDLKDSEVNPKVESKSQQQSETNNNVLAETPTFTFNLPAKKVDNKIDTLKTKTEEVAPKVNFTFGIPKQIPKAATVNNVEVSKVVEEKPQEVPVVDLEGEKDKTAEPVSVSKPLGNMFTPAPTQVNSEKTPTLALNTSSLFNPLATQTKKDTTSSSSLQSAATAGTAKPSFQFGVKPSAQLFDKPSSSTANAMNLFLQPTQTNTLPATSGPALSLFKMPETSTSTSLFPQPDPPVAPAPLFQKSETASTAPVFSFGNNASSIIPAAAPAMSSAPEKPKFQFTFGSNNNNAAPKTDPPALFKSPFAASESNVANTNSFALSASTLGSSNPLSTNTLGGTNGLSATNGISGNTMGMLPGNSMSGNSMAGNGVSTNNTLGTNGLSINPLSPGNNLQSGSTNLFGGTVQKDNMWAANNNAPTTNLFVSNTVTSSLQKAPTFTFGSPPPFNANTTPAFGSNAAPTQNIFGMSNQNNNTQPLMFSNAVQSQPTGMFGSPQPPSNPGPQMGMFGTPSMGATSTFGTPNQSMPSFEAPSLTPASSPAFNFGGQQSTGIFGFGQQPQQLQQPQLQHQQQPQLQQHLQHPQPSQQTAGVYSFGGAPAAGPQVQFSMGSGANTAVRRVRKAVRRNPQR